MMKNLQNCLAAMLVCSACGGSSPVAPTTPLAPPTALPLALAGQSNALFITPFLTAAAAPEQVVGFAQDGSTIRQWAVSAPEGYWAKLLPSIHQRLRAFVWWQGESNRDTVDEYAATLPELLGRVRVEAGNPSLLVVVCRVIDNPAFAGVRAAQEAYVRSDAHAVLVSSDGLELESPVSAHLSAEGYRVMSQRILAVVR